MKKWLLAAALALMFLGAIVFFGAFAAADFRWDRLNTQKAVENVYTVSDPFASIEVDTDMVDVTFRRSEGDVCRIECKELEKMTHEAFVESGKLIVRVVDTRKWTDHIGMFIGDLHMTVYLPKDEYESLYVRNTTGDVSITKDVRFRDVKVKCSTGDVDCSVVYSASISIKTSTGDIKVENSSADEIGLTATTGKISATHVNCSGKLTVEVSTGDTKLKDITCERLVTEGTTGAITLSGVMASTMDITRKTGDVMFDRSDAGIINVKTSTGDVTGTLLTDKVFVTKTSTGDVKVPKSASDGNCKIQTSTGDISIRICE